MAMLPNEQGWAPLLCFVGVCVGGVMLYFHYLLEAC